MVRVVAAPAAEPFKLKLDVFANFAQYVYDDENPENPIGPNPTLPANTPVVKQARKFQHRTPSCWRGRQAQDLLFPNSVYVQLAPTLYNYTGNGDYV